MFRAFVLEIEDIYHSQANQQRQPFSSDGPDQTVLIRMGVCPGQLRIIQVHRRHARTLTGIVLRNSSRGKQNNNDKDDYNQNNPALLFSNFTLELDTLMKINICIFDVIGSTLDLEFYLVQ